SFPHFKSFAGFNECFQPAERSAPSVLVILGLFEMARETGMTDSHHCAGADAVRAAAVQAMHFVRLEFPADDGGNVLCEIRRASVHEQARRIDLEILALGAKRPAVVSRTDFIPFAARAQIGV